MADILRKNSVYIEITPEELRRFNTIIESMVNKQHATFEKVTRNIARDVCRVALKNTPLAPKKRSRRIKGSDEYWIKLRNRFTGQMVTFRAPEEKCEKYGYKMFEEVKSRGMLQSGWAGALSKLGAGGNIKAKYTDKWAEVQKKGSKNEFMIKIIDSVPFALEWDQGRNRWHTPQRTIERAIRKCVDFWDRVLKKYANSLTLPKDAFRSVKKEDEALLKAQVPISDELNLIGLS